MLDGTSRCYSDHNRHTATLFAPRQYVSTVLDTVSSRPGRTPRVESGSGSTRWIRGPYPPITPRLPVVMVQLLTSVRAENKNGVHYETCGGPTGFA